MKQESNMRTLLILVMVMAYGVAEAGTTCRSHRNGSTTYTTCDGGGPRCRTFTMGTTTYTRCT